MKVLSVMEEHKCLADESDSTYAAVDMLLLSELVDRILTSARSIYGESKKGFDPWDILYLYRVFDMKRYCC